jgi:hypothetical protein
VITTTTYTTTTTTTNNNNNNNNNNFIIIKKSQSFADLWPTLMGFLDLHIETFGRTSWTGDQPDARPLPTQVNTTQKHADTHPCPKQDSNL